MIKPDTKPLRYHDHGNVHLDFHGATNTTIDFIIENYGIDAMNDIFARVGRDVYADIRRHLLAGNAAELAKHWQHYFEREGADFRIDVDAEAIVLTVNYCTAYHHVKKIAPKVSDHFCDQTVKTNDALAENGPFAIDTEITGPGACRQTIRKRR